MLEKNLCDYSFLFSSGFSSDFGCSSFAGSSAFSSAGACLNNSSNFFSPCFSTIELI